MYDLLLKDALNIQRDKKLGIAKNEKDYTFTFIYPPSQVLYKLEDNLFEDTKIVTANLYFHIPYCTGRCSYCYFGCYSLTVAPLEKSKYVDKIIKEIEMISQKFGRITILSIHFGGGTPTVLNEEEFEIIFNAIRKYFVLVDDIEITCESSPETLTRSKLMRLINLGVNRLNIGVQSLNDELLKSINRRHNSQKAISGIKLAQDLGLKNINVDIMYGLKGQTMNDWEDTLGKIFNLGLQSISTYRLRIHPKGKISSQINEFDEELAIRMYIRMMEMMEANIYYQCSSHKFAIKEELAQKQIINKRGINKNTLIPLGMAAYGYIGNVLYWNERTMEEYVSKVDSNKLPYSIGYVLDKTEEMAKACVLGIHNIHGIDLVKFRAKYNIGIRDVYPELITMLEKNELIDIDDNQLKPNKLGMIFADEIATEFYSNKIKKQLNMQGYKYGIFFDEILA